MDIHSDEVALIAEFVRSNRTQVLIYRQPEGHLECRFIDQPPSTTGVPVARAFLGVCGDVVFVPCTAAHLIAQVMTTPVLDEVIPPEVVFEARYKISQRPLGIVNIYRTEHEWLVVPGIDEPHQRPCKRIAIVTRWGKETFFCQGGTWL